MTVSLFGATSRSACASSIVRIFCLLICSDSRSFARERSRMIFSLSVCAKGSDENGESDPDDPPLSDPESALSPGEAATDPDRREACAAAALCRACRVARACWFAAKSLCVDKNNTTSSIPNRSERENCAEALATGIGASIVSCSRANEKRRSTCEVWVGNTTLNFGILP